MNAPSLSESLQHLGRSLAAQSEAETSDVELLRRYSVEADQNAFATIVQRHGPMVLSVCRRILPREVDAEDAFQATFVVLSKKAGTLRQGELLANWLHGVARRTAMKARGSAFRRFQQESQAAQMRTGSTSPAENEITDVLDEEMRRLPVKFRAPLLLCYMEGKSREEAAKELGCSPGAVKGNLERGRDLLRKRLSERGVACASAVLLGSLSPCSAVPPDLVSATMQAVSGSGSTSVAWLASKVTSALAIASTKSAATATVLAFALLTGGWMAFTGMESQNTQLAKEAQPEIPQALPKSSSTESIAPSTSTPNANGSTPARPEPKMAAKGRMDDATPPKDCRTSLDRRHHLDFDKLSPEQDLLRWQQILEIRMQTNNRGKTVKVEIRVFETEEDVADARAFPGAYSKGRGHVPPAPIPQVPQLLSKSEPTMW